MRLLLFPVIILCAWAANTGCAQAQTSTGAPSSTVNLYISKQTGQYNIYAGSNGKTTDKYESGSVSISTSGPIQYNVSPADFSIAPNQSKTWYGMIWGDVASGPAPGESAPATIMGNYNVTYSRPTATGGHEIVNQVNSQVLNFMVNSVNVTAVDTVKVCPNTAKQLYASGSPGGGSYSWAAGGNVTITAGANTQEPTIKCAAPGNGTATVTYTIEGVQYSATVNVICMNPTFTVNCSDTIKVGIGDKINLKSVVQPGTAIPQWTVSSGLKLNSSPYTLFPFITATGGGWQTITGSVNVCGKTITKVIKVYVNPCMVYAPDSVIICMGVNTDITASGNTNGNFKWTSGGGITIAGGGSTATVTINGAAATTAGWADVQFTTADCDIHKKIKVIVLAKPTLKIYASFGSLDKLCKSERRILNADAQPAGGTLTWSLSSNSLTWYGPPGTNNRNPVVQASAGGACTITCTYEVCGQKVTATQDVYVNDYSKIEIASSVAGQDINSGTKVTYTATVYDFAGKVVNPAPALHWRVVYIPVGQDNNVGNWVSYDLQGTGASMDYTWGFPQGNYPLPAAGPPYKMRAWIQASEYCTYHSGSVHINVVSQNGKN